MEIKKNELILDSEINDEMIEEFLKMAQKKKVEKIVINIGNISSAVLQAIFCISQYKTIVCNDPFLNKFFMNIVYSDNEG